MGEGSSFEKIDGVGMSLYGGGWNLSFSRPFNDWEFGTVRNFLLRIQDRVVVEEREDVAFWADTESGSFSVKDFYYILEEVRVDPFPSNVVWNDWVPPKKKEESVESSTIVPILDNLEGEK
ncbi:hypothetical protein AAG906_001651 [Vitis piasezkii]